MLGTELLVFEVLGSKSVKPRHFFSIDFSRHQNDI